MAKEYRVIRESEYGYGYFICGSHRYETRETAQLMFDAANSLHPGFVRIQSREITEWADDK